MDDERQPHISSNTPGARTRTWLGALVLVALVVAFWAPTVTNPLASDDYLLVDIASRGFGAALQYHGSYHYIPVGMSLLALEYAAWGTDPAGYHWTTIALLALTALLTVAVGRQSGLGEAASWAAALLVASNGLIHEIPLWACAALHSASTCVYLCALLAFVRFLKGGGARFAALAVVLYAIALLTHEQSLSFPLAALLAATGVAAGSDGPSRRAVLLALGGMLAVASGWLALKLALSDGTPQAPGLASGAVTLAGSSLMHTIRVFVPNLDWRTAMTILDPPLPGAVKQLARLAVVATCAGVFALLPRKARVLSLWAAGHVVMMVLAIGISSRHYLLPLIPASLVVGTVVHRLASRLARSFASQALVIGLLLSPIVAIGAAESLARRAVWREAGIIALQIVDDAARAVEARPDAFTLYAVNLPDGLDLGESEPAYVARFGFETALAWRLAPRVIGIARLRSYDPPPRTEPFGRVASAGELETLASRPENVVVRYDPGRRRLQPVAPAPDRTRSPYAGVPGHR